MSPISKRALKYKNKAKKLKSKLKKYIFLPNDLGFTCEVNQLYV